MSPWIEPDDRDIKFEMDTVVLDQDGNELKIADLVGKPLVLSFFFTRCPDRNVCPLIVTTAGFLEDQLVEAGLEDDVNIVLISYDAIHDTPAILKEYGKERGVDFKTIRMVVAKDPETVGYMLHEYSATARMTKDGSFAHVIELLLIDKQGRFVRDYGGEIWENEQVIADIRKLIAE